MVAELAGKVLVEGAKAAAKKAVETSVESAREVVKKTVESVKDFPVGSQELRGRLTRIFNDKIPSFDKGQFGNCDVGKRFVDSNENIPKFDVEKVPQEDSRTPPEVEPDRSIPRFVDAASGAEEPDVPGNNPDVVSGQESVGVEEIPDAAPEVEDETDDACIDDNGKVFKDKNGDLLPNTQYEINGTTYTTDDNGRIVSAEGYLKDTPDNERDNSAQSDAGGKDRKSGDDGGHLRARMNGGSSGNENLVAMRDTINRGDYKRSENEENQMLKDGKQVYEKIEVTYDDDSSRPSKIEKTYTDGEKTVKVSVDNVEGSTDLVETLDGEISDQDLDNLQNEIDDMKADGNEVSVTSVRREYDSEGNPKSVTVCVTNETTGEKDYITYSPANGGKE